MFTITYAKENGYKYVSYDCLTGKITGVGHCRSTLEKNLKIFHSVATLKQYTEWVTQWRHDFKKYL